MRKLFIIKLLSVLSVVLPITEYDFSREEKEFIMISLLREGNIYSLLSDKPITNGPFNPEVQHLR